MMACYIIYSTSLDRFYTAITQESMENRLEIHNKSGYGDHYTSQSSDWEIFLIIPCISVSLSIKIVRHIKKMKSKLYIQNLKKYPERVEKILIKNS